jgi:very-short-patch-repair endonuclease
MPPKHKKYVCTICQCTYTTKKSINKKLCSNICKEAFKLTKEYKEKREKSRKKRSKALNKAHAEGRHPGWFHINSKTNRRSFPEEFFFEGLRINEIQEKYTFIEKLSVGKYFLDFALIDLKLDIEIDGAQHTRSPEAIEHDRIRDNFLREKGWIIYRISWQELRNTPDQVWDEFKDYLKSENFKDRRYEISEIVITNQKKYGSREKYRLAVLEETDNKEKPKIKLVKESNIDFGKLGWVSKVAKIIDKRPQKVNQWMKRYMLDFYENECFKRKAS